MVTNFGVEPVHGFEMTTTLNNHASFTTIHQATVGAGETIEAILPELALRNDSNDIEIAISLLGGESDDLTTNDTYEQRFSVDAQDYVTMELNTDDNANFLSWRIEDAQGEVVMNGGDYPAGVNTYIEEGCMPAGCYTLIMEDQMGYGGLCAQCGWVLSHRLWEHDAVQRCGPTPYSTGCRQLLFRQLNFWSRWPKCC